MFFVTGVGDQIEVLTVLPKFRKIRENAGFWSTYVINPKCFFNRAIFLIRGWGYILTWCTWGHLMHGRWFDCWCPRETTGECRSSGSHVPGAARRRAPGRRPGERQRPSSCKSCWPGARHAPGRRLLREIGRCRAPGRRPEARHRAASRHGPRLLAPEMCQNGSWSSYFETFNTFFIRNKPRQARF